MARINDHPNSWRKNLTVLWFGTFMAGIGFSEVMPFLSLYVDTLGNFSHDQLSLYSGFAFAATYLVTALASPFWGKLADRTGRKLMLVRASAGMAIVFFLMGLVTNVWELIGLRLLQGVFSGYISNANALIATQVPKSKSGQALGTLVTGNVSGTLLGPLLGGILASLFSYRVTFFITGFLLLSVFFLTLFLVHEDFKPVAKTMMLSTRGVIKRLTNSKLVFGMFITTMIIQAANNSIAPILALYVRQIMHNSATTTFYSGIVAAVPGIATLVAAPMLGKLGDRIGTDRIIIIGFFLAIVVYIPMAFVTNIWQLIALRFLIGIANASMLPAVQAILAKNTPFEVTGRVFSWNQSFQAMGNVAGPMIGSVISSEFDYAGVFISTAVLVVLNLILVYNNTRVMRKNRA
ncbi:MAG: multidrug efflux MFS transporter [Lentilactobacillus hilgardii]|uniref:Transporter, major facilitator family protein n=2 Tax=Lentilactobacillus hilgardii TaxID=1588 RepID=C0XFT8_LENH9|nr:multidrug efflux MFS transporter [Lentilactobacillus hilgardii]RRG08525.1 MAG: MFS transporter [Lactobacillus sp.]EEI25760.1 transporter, major facilitator family protein [Lentilactobacillus hilgardii DSM 20176 = ATCC 8290]EEI71289.1 transporter, major facilitator family protein [Lentilactobacillus hilgardii ATCC 27305]MBZ2201486.1 MFS transporter [Lentilactobacillus hilgardii]MBZ2204796.1 MFS transporter [Lentilactobacillus hilgardii]